MGKVKTKKHDTFIDMTAMSDVTVLLLTFFMLTATFLPKEPVAVISPSSVSETKIPESNVMTILIDEAGQVFINLDNPVDKKKVIQEMNAKYNLKLNEAQISSFENQTHIGVPLKELSSMLNLPLQDQDDLIKKNGIPIDTILSSKNEFAMWVRAVRGENEKITVAIKSDQDTPYSKVKIVLSTLQDLKENRYSLITTLRKMPDGV